MICVIQRVTDAHVKVSQQIIGEINHGLVALLAIEKEDNKALAEKMIERILNYRIFADEHDKMNLSLRDIDGGLLLVPQFTLAADTQKGTRPSFSPAAQPSIAKPIFEATALYAASIHSHFASGLFGADMQVSLCNDGPVTFTLQSRP